ncbi:hypothetical protein KQX54_020951 [Cotesia glomerata]|uniref:Uncharacterized protein n=1 Tax=Cotesia glomerata TaxID=32391 RepID=A0AAV7I541_COTGL|nr:hypothetical protein KQX54_020951 [Cotesia glomerata]
MCRSVSTPQARSGCCNKSRTRKIKGKKNGLFKRGDLDKKRTKDQEENEDQKNGRELAISLGYQNGCRDCKRRVRSLSPGISPTFRATAPPVKPGPLALLFLLELLLGLDPPFLGPLPRIIWILWSVLTWLLTTVQLKSTGLKNVEGRLALLVPLPLTRANISVVMARV